MPTLNLGRVRFNWRGEYNPLADYQEYDTVKADGQSYVCIGDVSGVGPLDPDGGLYWDSMLVRGADYNAARDQALQFANDSQESATLAGTRANEAQDAAAESSASMEMAERWANEEEDVEVSPGEFSAYHWYKKAEALGSPNEFDLTADQTSDTRKAKEWMAQVLANQQQGNDNIQALAQHVLADDPHSQYEKKTELKEAAYRTVLPGFPSKPLLPEGSFGLGSSGQSGESGIYIDAEDKVGAQATGFYSWSGASHPVDVPPLLQVSWPSIWINKRTPSTGSGLLMDILGNLFSFRISNGEIDPSSVRNRRYYSDKNIVGTVSQSGGFPSGAIMQRGKNDFGEWVKFACGVMWAWEFGKEVVVSTTTTDSLPSGWARAGLSGGNAIIFPQEFSDPPFVTCMNRNPAAGSSYLYGMSFDLGVTITTTEARPQIIFPHGAQSNRPVQFSWFAAGHWFKET